MNKRLERDVEAVTGVMETVFSAQRILRAIAPEWKWAGLGNLLGDYGEYLAIHHYNLKKAPSSTDGYDAIRRDGKIVEIKTNHSSGQIGFRGEADLMLVLHVNKDGSWEEIYYGDFSRVKRNARYSKRDNKHTITISKLKKMSKK